LSPNTPRKLRHSSHRYYIYGETWILLEGT
jgi:hypothetical protein